MHAVIIDKLHFPYLACGCIIFVFRKLEFISLPRLEITKKYSGLLSACFTCSVKAPTSHYLLKAKKLCAIYNHR